MRAARTQRPPARNNANSLERETAGEVMAVDGFNCDRFGSFELQQVYLPPGGYETGEACTTL